MAFAPGPVIDSQVTNGQAGLLGRFLLDAAEDGVVAGAHGQTLEDPLPWTATGHVADQSHDAPGSERLLVQQVTRRRDSKQLLSFNRPRLISHLPSSFGEMRNKHLFCAHVLRKTDVFCARTPASTSYGERAELSSCSPPAPGEARPPVSLAQID
jgi:hypothetical protein